MSVLLTLSNRDKPRNPFRPPVLVISFFRLLPSQYAELPLRLRKKCTVIVNLYVHDKIDVLRFFAGHLVSELVLKVTSLIE